MTARPQTRKIEIVSPIWPSEGSPAYGVFVKNIADALGEAGFVVDSRAVVRGRPANGRARVLAHLGLGGPTIDRHPLRAYVGPCQVVQVGVAPGGRVRPSDLAGGFEAPRLLIRTRGGPSPERWDEGFAGLSPEFVDWAADRGALLLGIDSPSVDPFSDPRLEAH